ncbi:hypothetical protein Poly30_01370 [Planctomycetes bacterium Poly30]|uniref:Alginate export domain-containing protein n=1 Tax=Saltatorellus ferox TaxID=2528018 RepID=A0A518EKN7_9BACT|nr:hypothetical protein Poly30_01370 [Planctomycetes bacterium Poly30]
MRLWTLTACLSIGTTFAQESLESVRPAYSFLRQHEDWSRFFVADETEDAFDRIKHMKLSEDGRIWLSLGGRLEARFESWKNFGFAKPNDDAFTVSRALAHADLHLGEHVRVFVEGKTAQATDRDLPGGRRPLDLDTVDLQQAFVDVKFRVGEGTLRLRPGRQMLLFGAQRLVSPLPWGNTLRTWEGLTAEWTTGPWSITGLATVFVPVNKTSFNTPDDDQTLWGLYAHRKPLGGLPGIELFALANERTNVSINGTTGNEERVTFGTRVFGNAPRRLDYEVELAWQTGEVGNADVNAWSVASQLGWKPEGAAGSPRLWVGFDAASGDDQSGGDVGTFHQLFPLGHAYFGFIDAVGRQNIMDTSLGGMWALSDKTKLGVAAHYFRLMETSDALYNAGGAPSRTGFDSSDVGTELDLTAFHKVDLHTQLYGGYSHFWPGDGLSGTGPAEDVDFLYVGIGTTF